MGKRLLNIPKYILALAITTLNMIAVTGLLVSAYSGYVNPQVMPRLSFVNLLFPAFLMATLAFLPVWFLLGVLGMKFESRKRRRKRSAYMGMLISIIGLLVTLPALRTYCPVNLPAEPPQGAIKVVSYNMLSIPNKENLPWDEHPIVRFLLDCEADIVCTQESGPIYRDPVDSILATKYPYRENLYHNNMRYACLSHFPIVGTDTISYISEGNGSVVFHLDLGNDTLTIVDNHLESYKLMEADREEYREIIRHKDSVDLRRNLFSLSHKLIAANVIRSAQADSVAAYVDRHGAQRIIVVGDFNDGSLSYTHNRLTRQLNDAYTRSGNGVGVSYNQNGMYFRIDNILVSPDLTPYQAQVEAVTRLSDHYPISCYVTLGPRP